MHISICIFIVICHFLFYLDSSIFRQLEVFETSISKEKTKLLTSGERGPRVEVCLITKCFALYNLLMQLIIAFYETVRTSWKTEKSFWLLYLYLNIC